MKRIRGYSRGTRGFSLVEILVALVLLAIALTTITVLYVGHHTVQNRLGQQWAAQNFLTMEMEALGRGGPLEEGRQEIELGTDRPVPLGIPSETALLILDAEPWVDAGPDDRLQHVKVTLQWTWHGEPRQAGLETIITGPAP